MKWKRRKCKMCGKYITGKGINLGKSVFGKKLTYWAHEECINNMRDFVTKLQDEEYMRQVKEEARYYGKKK